MIAVALLICCTPAPRAPVKPDWRPLTQYLDSVVAAGAAPGAVVAISWHGRRFVHGTGHIGQGISGRPDGHTVYDLASLTKVIGLTTAVMMGVDEGRLWLDSTVARWVPAFRVPGKDHVTLRNLLTHSSGLPAWRRLYDSTTSRDEAIALADTTPLDTVPGARFLYSDLGAIVLTQVVETEYGQRLDSLVTRRVFEPLGLSSTRWLPPSSWLPRIAPTELDTAWRKRMLRGEVHDENASRLDGVSGHAGLFSDADDLARFGEWLLSALGGGTVGSRSRSGPTEYGVSPPRAVTAFIQRQELPPGSSRALGWDTPSENSSAGTRLSPQSFGHTGFTGTSIWLDPSRDLVVVLLSNRVNPSRSNTRWGATIRGHVADLAVAAVDGQAP
ncbi:MAG TPA: serine hydrolase domain-containing protein [Gemmatimonadales bacterium]|nr:serine hydrolase domain-containing protein [Gemmatimonadales bacterium]